MTEAVIVQVLNSCKFHFAELLPRGTKIPQFPMTLVVLIARSISNSLLYTPF